VIIYYTMQLGRNERVSIEKWDELFMTFGHNDGMKMGFRLLCRPSLAPRLALPRRT